MGGRRFTFGHYPNQERNTNFQYFLHMEICRRKKRVKNKFLLYDNDRSHGHIKKMSMVTSLINNVNCMVSRPQQWSIFRAMRCRWFIFEQRCDIDYFWKSLTSPSSRLFSLTIGNDYFSIILLILGPIILGLFTD